MTDETVANVPILILGNKIDRPEAISEERLREMFGLYGQTTGKSCMLTCKFSSTVCSKDMVTKKVSAASTGS